MENTTKSSGLSISIAVIGFVFGLIGMIISFIPLFGGMAAYIAIPSAIISLISILIAISNSASRTFPIVAMTISMIGVVISLSQQYYVDKLNKEIPRNMEKALKESLSNFGAIGSQRQANVTPPQSPHQKNQNIPRDTSNNATIKTINFIIPAFPLADNKKLSVALDIVSSSSKNAGILEMNRAAIEKIAISKLGRLTSNELSQRDIKNKTRGEISQEVSNMTGDNTDVSFSEFNIQ